MGKRRLAAIPIDFDSAPVGRDDRTQIGSTAFPTHTLQKLKRPGFRWRHWLDLRCKTVPTDTSSELTGGIDEFLNLF